MCYRGRILVQLETVLDAEVENDVEEIPQEDVALVQPFLRRRKYKLYACFMEATMIAIDDSPVEFEISIGTLRSLSITEGGFYLPRTTSVKIVCIS